MSNGLFANYRNQALIGNFNWTSVPMNVYLIYVTDYTANLATDQHFSAVAGGAIVATASLSGASASGGVANASNVTFSAVTGSQVGAILIAEYTGNPSTDRLVAWIDTASGLPLTPNGSDILIQWDTGANKVFAL
jgi:hypothetical protein